MDVVTDQTTAHPTTPLAGRSPAEREALREELHAAYAQVRARGVKLDLTRGKPSAAQLDLSEALLSLPTGHVDASGTDVRNYGGLQGIAQIRDIFGELLGVDPAQLVAGGNSSLSMMKEVLLHLLLLGGVDSPRPWSQEESVRFICPVPGYDRHFTLLQHFGIEMVTVPMTDDGPDAEAAARLAADDPSVKGMWVVPTYANPTGAVCTQEVAARLASMSAAAPDFTIFWDNAYALHHLTEHETKSADVLALASAAGHPNRAFMFASTSKITFAGAGVAFLASSPENVAWYLKNLGTGSIGPDKVNQLRHAEFFGSPDAVRAHMVRHREVIAPKFAEVDRILTQRLGGLGVASWTHPIGGYFVSLDVVPGTASRVVALANDAGIALTPAGASFPHGDDPEDTNIRLAPTMPPVEEVTQAMDAVATCVLIAALEEFDATGAGKDSWHDGHTQ